MNQGDTLICHATSGYNFTEGKEYTCLDFMPRAVDDVNPGFTWPAYVDVLDDAGKKVRCHADRFTVKDSA